MPPSCVLLPRLAWRDMPPPLLPRARVQLPIPGKGPSEWYYSWIPGIAPFFGGEAGCVALHPLLCPRLRQAQAQPAQPLPPHPRYTAHSLPPHLRHPAPPLPKPHALKQHRCYCGRPVHGNSADEPQQCGAGWLALEAELGCCLAVQEPASQRFTALSWGLLYALSYLLMSALSPITALSRILPIHRQFFAAAVLLILITWL